MISLCGLLFVLLLCSSVVPAVIVNITNGPIEGDTLGLHDGSVVNTFLGVPYARPPTGSLRWRAPEDPDPWSEVFVADQFGPACPQHGVDPTPPNRKLNDENCLHLNIYAPANRPNSTLYPTMVFIHGGAYEAGSNSEYVGHFLAAKDVVVVVPNYRLTILGFATTADDAAPGNYGLLDQLHALRWVQDNIEAFGGDPDQVTLFGESAGAHSTGLMIVSPLSEGLFHKAILQSGNEMSAFAVNRPIMHPEEHLRIVAGRVGCSTINNEEMMDCLRLVDDADLIRASRNCTNDVVCVGFAPVVDGSFLPDLPSKLRQEGKFARVPEMIGINSEDGFFFAWPDIRDGPSRQEFEDTLRSSVSFYRQIGFIPDAENEEDVYEALLWFYSPWPHLDSRIANRDSLGYLETDFRYGASHDTQLKSHSTYSPSYEYIFSYVSDAALMPGWMGCTHTMELPFVFGSPLLQFNENVRNQSGIIGIVNWTDRDVAYSEYMMTLWTNFAKNGNPTPQALAPPTGGEAFEWAEFTGENLNYIFVSNDVIEVRQNYRQLEYSFWNAHLNWLITGGEWPWPFEA